MTAPDKLRQLANHEIHRMERKLNEAQDELESIKLILTEIKWVQEQEDIDERLC